MFNALFSDSGHASPRHELKIRPHNVACLVLDRRFSRELHNLNNMNFPALKMAGFSLKLLYDFRLVIEPSSVRTEGSGIDAAPRGVYGPRSGPGLITTLFAVDRVVD